MQLNKFYSCASLPLLSIYSSCTLWASENICQRCSVCLTYFSFFSINIAFRVRRNVLHREDDFLFNGSNRENFIKIPLTNLDRGKTLLCFESVLFQEDCPYFLGKLFSGNGFIPKCITKFAICTWCALNTVSYCFIFLFSPFSLHLSQNRFLFRNFSSFFLFFFWASLRRNYAFSKFWILGFFMIHLSVTTLVPVHLWSVSLKKIHFVKLK